MRLPRNILSGNYTKPRLFLCETDKSKICQLETSNTKGSFKFNSYSELSFEVGRFYNDIMSGEVTVNPYYDKIEALRLIYLEGIGYFEIQGPELIGDGIKEAKSITAYSSEYTLSQKYLEDFYINTGEIGSVEVTYAEDHNQSVIPVTLYNPNNKELSLLHLVLEKIYGWKINHVDSALQSLSRSFEVDRQSVYDFLINELCQKFNCYIVFDTINNEINIYAESVTSKFIGDGLTKTFTISPPFAQIGTVSVDGYKTTRWEYNSTTGMLTLEDIPDSGAHIEVIDGALTEWETDVFVTFDNLSQEIKVNYSADDIKTVLTVTYGEDGDIREANLGLPYITDLSYYYTVDWMGQDLYDAYTKYLQKSNSLQLQYTDNSQQMLEIAGRRDFEQYRLSLGYSVVQSVGPETVGTYYVRGGTDPNYYYTEVSLPAEYNANTTYYRTDTTNLNEEKVSDLYEILKKFFYNYFNHLSGTKNEAVDYEAGMKEARKDLETIEQDFQFMEEFPVSYLYNGFSIVMEQSHDGYMVEFVSDVVINFLREMWRQIGTVPLKDIYMAAYKGVQVANMEAGWSKEDDLNYGYYYPVTLVLRSIDLEMAEKQKIIDGYNKEYTTLQNANTSINNNLLMSENFTENQLIRLSAFLREDELQLDDIVETDQDSLADSYKIKQDAMESGRIELNKRCQPQLQFSMSMANIYALPEFEPIIDQFQLGKVIKVGIRNDYIKQSRLLQVDIGFDDFTDFSCEFGELTSLRSQSDIHADLLKKAVQAGKSVATNSSYWTKGADKSNSIDLRLQEGLLNSIEAIKAIDGTQNAYMDKWGIHLEAVNPETGEVSDKRVWMVNNQIVFTDDGFKTSKSVLGEFTVDGITYYGLLAQAVIAGLVEGSTIIGGTINIGNGAFVVHADGTVTMSAPGTTIDGYAKEDYVDKQITSVQDGVKTQITLIQDQIDSITNSKMYRVEIITNDSQIITSKDQIATLSCRVYSWDEDITATIDAENFNWIRTSNDSSADDTWNNDEKHKGIKTLAIKPEDIAFNASFSCQVTIPD